MSQDSDQPALATCISSRPEVRIQGIDGLENKVSLRLSILAIEVQMPEATFEVRCGLLQVYASCHGL